MRMSEWFMLCEERRDDDGCVIDVDQMFYTTYRGDIHDDSVLDDIIIKCLEFRQSEIPGVDVNRLTIRVYDENSDLIAFYDFDEKEWCHILW